MQRRYKYHTQPDEQTLTARAEAYRNLGNEECRKRDFVNAFYYYTQGIKVNCNDHELNAKLYSNRAIAQFYLGNYQESLNDSKAATNLQPTSVNVIVLGASACVELKQFEEAITWCDKGLALEENNKELLKFKSRSVKAKEELQQQLEEKVKEELKTTKEGKGDDVTDTVQTNTVNENEATESADRALNNDGGSLKGKAELFKKRGNDEYGKKNFSNAIHLYTEGIKANCEDEDLNAKLYSNRAIAHFYSGNYHDSVSDAKAATELQPNFLKAIIRGASACVELKQFEEAITWCDKGLALDENNKDLLEFKARSVKAKEELRHRDEQKELETTKDKGDDVTETVQTNSVNENEATESTEKGVDENDDSLRDKAELYKKRGNDEYGKKNFINAVHFYTEGIKVNCKDDELNAKLYNNRATAHFYLGYYHHSLIDAKAATELQPNFLKAIIRGANACFQLKKFEKARRWCETGLAIDRNNKQLTELKTRSFAERLKLGLKLQQMNCDVCQRFCTTTYVSKAEKLENLLKTEIQEEASISSSNQSNALPGISEWHAKNNPRELSRKTTAKDDTVHTSHQQITECTSESLQMPREIDGSYEDTEYYNSCLSVAKKEGDKMDESNAYLNLGHAFNNLADFKKAIQYYNLHLNISKEINDKHGEGCAYGNLGIAFSNLGDFKKALEYHTLRLSVAKEMGDEAAEGRAYGNIGNAYADLGDFRQALKYHKLRLYIYERFGDNAGMSRAYGDLGNAFNGLGDFHKAIEYYNLQLSIVTVVGDKIGEERAYGNLGNAYQDLGDCKKKHRVPKAIS